MTLFCYPLEFPCIIHVYNLWVVSTYFFSPRKSQSEERAQRLYVFSLDYWNCQVPVTFNLQSKSMTWLRLSTCVIRKCLTHLRSSSFNISYVSPSCTQDSFLVHSSAQIHLHKVLEISMFLLTLRY